MLVTADCVDPRFNDPYVDIDEQRTTPVPHRYVHGGFKGTDAKFSFYFPPREQFQGRFFQNTHQLLTSENGPPGNIGFAVASGAYYVQTNIGGVERATTTEQAVFGKLDPTVGGYRVNAEAAKFSRVKAAEIYGNRRIYGYLYGGSGGAFQTISSAENTIGVWDGFVPYVMGSPNAIPGVMTVRIHALRVLRQGQVPRHHGRDRPWWQRRPVCGSERGGASGAQRSDATGIPAAGLVEPRNDERRASRSRRRLRTVPGSDVHRRLLDQAGLPRHRPSVIGFGRADPARSDRRQRDRRPSEAARAIERAHG